jgi:hypothetical protein
VPLEERLVERARNFLRELRLAGARFALDQQWPAERYGGIDRKRQFAGRDVAVGSRKGDVTLFLARVQDVNPMVGKG